MNLVLLLKRMPRKFIFIGLVLVIAGIAIFSRRSPDQSPEVITVKRQEIKQQISASGRMAAHDSLKLGFPTSGRLSFIKVKEGERVSKGQALAGIENTQQLAAFNQAKNNLRELQATVDKVIDDIHLFQYGMGGFDNVGTKNETMTQIQQRTVAEVNRDNAQDSIKIAQKNLSDTILLSPVEGLVVSIEAPVGEVTGQTPVIRIADLSQVFFEAEVDESDLEKIKVGQEVEVTLDAYPNLIFKGNLDQILPKVSVTSTGALVVIVKVILNNFPPFFVEGLNGQALFTIASSDSAITIPLQALTENQTVIIQTPTGPKERKVALGIQTDELAEIKEGLNEEDRVVLNPADAQKQRGGILGIFRFGRSNGR